MTYLAALDSKENSLWDPKTLNADIGIDVLTKEYTTGSNSEGKHSRAVKTIKAALPDQNRELA